MKIMFEQYKPRRVKFEKIAQAGDWKVKVYSITKNEKFRSVQVLENATANLKAWLKISNKLESPTYDIATLIVHEGRDAVWTLVNWWTGGEMLQNITFWTDRRFPDRFDIYPKDGSMACVWEMSVIVHERKAWIRHILKNADAPKFEDYLHDTISGII